MVGEVIDKSGASTVVIVVMFLLVPSALQSFIHAASHAGWHVMSKDGAIGRMMLGLNTRLALEADDSWIDEAASAKAKDPERGEGSAGTTGTGGASSASGDRKDPERGEVSAGVAGKAGASGGEATAGAAASAPPRASGPAPTRLFAFGLTYWQVASTSLLDDIPTWAWWVYNISNVLDNIPQLLDIFLQDYGMSLDKTPFLGIIKVLFVWQTVCEYINIRIRVAGVRVGGQQLVLRATIGEFACVLAMKSLTSLFTANLASSLEDCVSCDSETDGDASDGGHVDGGAGGGADDSSDNGLLVNSRWVKAWLDARLELVPVAAAGVPSAPPTPHARRRSNRQREFVFFRAHVPSALLRKIKWIVLCPGCNLRVFHARLFDATVARYEGHLATMRFGGKAPTLLKDAAGMDLLRDVFVVPCHASTVNVKFEILLERLVIIDGGAGPSAATATATAVIVNPMLASGMGAPKSSETFAAPLAVPLSEPPTAPPEAAQTAVVQLPAAAPPAAAGGAAERWTVPEADTSMLASMQRLAAGHIDALVRAAADAVGEYRKGVSDAQLREALSELGRDLVALGEHMKRGAVELDFVSDEAVRVRAMQAYFRPVADAIDAAVKRGATDVASFAKASALIDKMTA